MTRIFSTFVKTQNRQLRTNNYIMNRILPLIILLHFCCLLLPACHGQISTSATANTAAGGNKASALPDSILVIFQDNKNNYWFGSNGRGVFKYNGNGFTLFTTAHGLSNNRIWAIQQDKAGNMYFTTATGVDKYDGKTITNLQPVANADTNIWQFNRNDMWFKVGMDDGHPYRYDGEKLYRLTFPKNPREDEWNKMYPNTTFSPYSIYTIYTDSKGRVWFGTGALGVGVYDGTAFEWITSDDVTELHNGPSNGVRSILEDKNGDFWFNTFYRYQATPIANGGIHISRKTGMVSPVLPGGGLEYMSATLDKNGDMWIATFRDGVYKYDASAGLSTSSETVTRYNVKPTLFAIYKDNAGTLWLATHTDGAYKWNGTAFEKAVF